MSFFDEMKESLVSAGKDVSQKAKEVSGVAKLKLDVKSKEDYVEKQYAELGRTYFDAHKDDEENAENEQFKVIKEALAEMKKAAEAGRDSTKDMVAKFGRSSRLGERSRGVLDAGATSCCIILSAMADGISELL